MSAYLPAAAAPTTTTPASPRVPAPTESTTIRRVLATLNIGTLRSCDVGGFISLVIREQFWVNPQKKQNKVDIYFNPAKHNDISLVVEQSAKLGTVNFPIGI